MSGQIEKKLENAAIVLAIIMGIFFASIVELLCVKLGWPKNIANWFSIGEYAFLSVLFFACAYLGRQISKMP